MRDNHKPNHKCLACGTEYYACDSCDKKIDKTWRAACCTEGHYRAYYAMWQYCQGQIGKEAVQNVLAEQGALEWEKAPEKGLIEQIMEGYKPETPEEPEEKPEPRPVAEVYRKKNKKRQEDE